MVLAGCKWSIKREMVGMDETNEVTASGNASTEVSGFPAPPHLQNSPPPDPAPREGTQRGINDFPTDPKQRPPRSGFQEFEPREKA